MESKRKHFVIAFKRFDTGGLQTLMVRMAVWCKKNNVDATIVYQTADDRMHDEIVRNDISTEHFDKDSIVALFRSIILDGEEIRLLSFELPEFLYLERIINKYFKKQGIYHLMYNVAVSSTIYGNKIKLKLPRAVCFWAYKKIIKSLISSDRITFMDTDTLEACCSYYKIDKATVRDPVYLLPMFINDIPENIVKNNKRITTVSRAAFPYKGYLVDLISHFDVIKVSIPDALLTIVSYGPDIDRLKTSIAQSKYSSDIQLIEGATIDEINRILDDTRLYIGMGTTVLDAANKAVPTIPVWHSTMECITSGMFSDNPQTISKWIDKADINELIINTLSMSDAEYCVLSKATYVAYKDHYDIDLILPEMLDRNQSLDIKIPFIPFVIHNTLYFIKKFLGKYN